MFTESLKHSNALYNDDTTSVIYRHGLMGFKIAMVLSALRSNESEIT